MKHKERGNTHMAKEQLIFCGSSETFLDKALTADSNADNGGNAFRIPSLVNADGTLIAAIDRASCGADCDTMYFKWKEGIAMAVTYKKLFHLLIDRGMTNAELMEKAGFSANIITRIKRDNA